MNEIIPVNSEIRQVGVANLLNRITDTTGKDNCLSVDKLIREKQNVHQRKNPRCSDRRIALPVSEIGYIYHNGEDLAEKVFCMSPSTGIKVLRKSL